MEHAHEQDGIWDASMDAGLDLPDRPHRDDI